MLSVLAEPCFHHVSADASVSGPRAAGRERSVLFCCLNHSRSTRSTPPPPLKKLVLFSSHPWVSQACSVDLFYLRRTNTSTKTPPNFLADRLCFLAYRFPRLQKTYHRRPSSLSPHLIKQTVLLNTPKPSPRPFLALRLLL